MSHVLDQNAVIDQKDYVIAGRSDKAGSIVKVFRAICEKHRLPAKLSEGREYEQGLFSNKEKKDGKILLFIDFNSDLYSVLDIGTYGDFLSVHIYFMSTTVAPTANLANSMVKAASLGVIKNYARVKSGAENYAGDVIKSEEVTIFWASVTQCLDETLVKLGITQ